MDSSLAGSITKLSTFTILLLFFLSSFTFTPSEAYDALDPNGNITIKWDVMSWTPDGYVAVVTMYNFQQYRHIQAPGWTLGWTWAKKEVIWSMVGAQTTEQGDCSKFKGNVPHCCKKDPTVVDLLPGTPYNQQIANCCKGGVINSWAQDPATAVSSFQVSVGAAGTSNKTVRLPKNFTLKAPGPGYTCGPAKIVRPTKFVTPDKRRVTQALMTWNVTCTYSQFLAQKTPTCCVSLSSFYNDTIVGCPTCACGCQNSTAGPGTCVDPDAPHLASVVAPTKSDNTPLVQYDTAMLWGVKFYNDFLSQAGPLGNVQSELLFRKDKSTFTFEKGWAFPRRIYFNGDNCVMPPPDAYPWLPNDSSRTIFSLFLPLMAFLVYIVFFSNYV
ncbi:Protein COBRA precursor, putative [Ricinus communis]|uniref:Protein COBRA, putative n=1 Tax=Ricinus communis TaxID=3988 RepID=B9RLL0_RICCO|nr:Protein COBRA precursor, putative [Ricinus communis]